MKLIKSVILILAIIILSNCSSVPKNDGAGHFNKLMTYKSGNVNYIDSQNINEGFDSIIFIHVKITDYSKKTFLSDELRDHPVLWLRMTNEYLNSDPALKDKVYWWGDMVRYYYDYIYGRWVRDENENRLEFYSISEVKSKINEIIIDNVHLKFSGDKSIRIPINKKLKITPGQLNYLGTLAINMINTGEYSGDVTSKAYIPGYGTQVTQKGFKYNINKKLEFNETDFKNDLNTIKSNYPNLFERYKDKIVNFKWD